LSSLGKQEGGCNFSEVPYTTKLFPLTSVEAKTSYHWANLKVTSEY